MGTLTYTTGALVILFCWLLWGDFAWSIKERSVPSIVQLLLKKFDASDTFTALLIGTLPQFIAMILGPVVGYLSDRHRGRMGRRIPFLLIPTPIALLSMIGLAFSPAIGQFTHTALGLHSPGLNLSVLFSIGLFWALFETAAITANAVYGALINDVVPHAVIGRFYAIFRAVTLLASILFNYCLIGKAETHFMWLFLGIGAIYAVGFITMCVKVKEGKYPPPPPAELSHAGSFSSAVKSYFRDCFSNPYYLWVFGAISLSWMAFTPINLFSVFFAKSINMNIEVWGKYIALTFVISFVLSYPLGALADRFHPLRVGLVVMALYAAVTLWGGLFAKDTTTYAIALVCHGVLSGAWITATASIGQMLLPKAKFAQFASAMALVTCAGTMLTGPFVGKFLDHVHHVYRYTYLASSGLAILALLTSVLLYSKFKKLGGPRFYIAPE